MRRTIRTILWTSAVFLLASASLRAQPVMPLAEAPPAPHPHGSEPVHPPEMKEPPCEQAESAGAFLLDADYLLLRTRRRPVDYAILGPSNPFGPQGDVRSLAWELDSGARVGGGYRMPDGWEVGFYYTYLHTNANDAAGRPAGATLFATLTHPNVVQQVDTAFAAGTLHYDLYDAEIARRFEPCERASVRLFAGPRFASIDQRIAAAYDGGDAHGDRVTSRVDFDGFGVRAGGEATWKITPGVGLYTRGAASLLSGNFRGSLLETTANGTSTVVNVTDRFHKLVPVLEMGFGLSVQYRHLRIAAGYELANWFGLGDAIDFVDDSHRGKPGWRVSDLGLDGLVVRASFEY
jgi:hypothetical protein